MTQTIELPHGQYESVSAVLAMLGHAESRLMDERHGTRRYLTQTGETIDIYDDFEDAVYMVKIHTK